MKHGLVKWLLDWFGIGMVMGSNLGRIKSNFIFVKIHFGM